MQAELRLDKKNGGSGSAAIDRVKMEMDIPAAMPVQETGEVDEVESPAFDGMDDDAFLGLNHQHFPDMEVSEGGVPPGTSKRPRQSLELAVTNSAPSFDTSVNAISHSDADQIQQLLQIAQMQLDSGCVSTLWVISELAGVTRSST